MDTDTKNGMLAWMAKNHVAANILMLTLVVGGLIVMSSIRQEVFPEYELDIVDVSVTYPLYLHTTSTIT
ncbi:MAG: hypothetical protein L0922_07640, partial [Candidatus Mariimomonas ferrooxydans]